MNSVVANQSEDTPTPSSIQKVADVAFKILLAGIGLAFGAVIGFFIGLSLNLIDFVC